MKLNIKNFAKIKTANIEINGITVIAGNNNTGKSTIGKVLYATCNGLYDLEHKIEKERRNEIFNICRKYLYQYTLHYKWKTKEWINFEDTNGDIVNAIVEELVKKGPQMLDFEMYMKLLNKILNTRNVHLEEADIQEFAILTYDKIAIRVKNDNQKIASELIGRYFAQVFGLQIQCLKIPEVTAEVELIFNHKTDYLQFHKNICADWKAEYPIFQEAFLIDNPFILDEIKGASEWHFITNSRGEFVQRLRKKLQETQNDIMKGLFDAVSARENLKEIYKKLNEVVNGDIAYQNNEWGLKTEDYSEMVSFENLSAGLKSFVLIKLLLEKGILKEKDILILDEPEIHLHPEWQLVYAELIVLLQKTFELSIVVTTHSSHFLEAIEYYSKKYGLLDKCKYYMANLEDGLAVFEDVTLSLDKVYKKMITPSLLLDQLKYEMDNENE